ncbi:MAG TPA: hypothetical protein VM287_03780 [Egibacteraceae bacterium]|nr:hypothetical protein [Egibacteraceae bacterium]
MSVLNKTGLVRAAARPRARQNRAARTARYLGLFAWFGGTAMNLIGVEPSAEEGGDLAEEAWRRWLPVAQGAIAAHVAGSAALGWSGRHRAWAQRGMPTAMALDTCATGVGIAAWLAGERLRRGLASGVAVRGRRGVRAARWLSLLGAGGSIAAQGFLAEQQRVTRTVKRARLPLPLTW